jgi:hypothetical protein
MVSSGRRHPPDGFALERLSICSKNFSSDRVGASFLTLGTLRPKCRRPRVQDFPGNLIRPSLRTLRVKAG